jgi:quinoprotein glucose dehydrogenase
VPDDLIDFTPAMRAQALENLKSYRVAGMYNPPLLGGLPGGLRGAINTGNAGGGTNWPGGGADPENHVVYAQAATGSVAGLSLREPPAGFSDIKYVSGSANTEFREALGPGFGTAADSPLAARGRAGAGAPAAGDAGGGRAGRGGRGAAAPAAGGGAAAAAAPGGGGGGLQVEGLPLVKPPYGVLAAIDLDKGELKWRVPHGDTPDNVRTNPALAGMTIPKTGQQGSVGLMVTKTLVVLGDPTVTATPGRPRGAMLRAYDKNNGTEVGAVWMPAAQSGSPMTYMVDGKQYIVVAVSGGIYTGEYLAFSLPNAGRTTTLGQR